MDEIKNLSRLIKGKKDELQKGKEQLGEVEKWDELILKKEKELKECKHNMKEKEDECFLASSRKKVTESFLKDIEEIKKNIEEYKKKKHLHETIISLEEEISQHEKKLEELNTTEFSPGDPWRFINDKKDAVFNENIKNQILKRIKELKISDMLAEKKWVKPDDKDKSAKQVPKFINAILIGSTGVGKSSFINTFATALKNNGELSTVTMDQQESSESATIKLLLSPLRFSNGDILMVKLFDCRGISDGIGHAEMEMIIRGHIKSNSEITNATEMENNPTTYREDPGLANRMHCVVYVVRADRSESWKNALVEMNAVRKIFTGENIPQCLLVTAVDTMGVPENDIKNIYKYPCVKHLCERAARDLQLPMKYVLPMSNYHNEGTPTCEKDALALHNFWKILHLGREHILQNENRNDIPEGFYD